MNLNKIKQFIEATSVSKHVNTSFIEKDFYAIALLKGIVQKADNIVFKGGTCLSKCFKVINRFSEDIDLSVIEEHLSTSVRRKLVHDTIEGTIKEVGLVEQNPENIRSRREFNRFICNYDPAFDGEIIESNVIVELAMMSPCFPYEIKRVQSFVGEYLDNVGRNDLTKEYGLEAFDVKVQKLERTFVDKIFALCDYQISKKLTRQSRHIYDLHKILPLIKLDNNLVNLFNEVKKYRIDNPTCYSAKEGIKLSDIFSNLINEDTFKNDFNNVTKPLLYDDVAYDECKASLIKILEFLLNNNF